MAKKVIILTLLLLVTLSLTVFAGTIQLPQTGQTKCYDEAGTEIGCAGTGQDGASRAGVAWPNPRFVVKGDCVSDNLTGLIWAKDGNLAVTPTWQGALDWVDSLNSGGGLCGQTDWRLPNRKELKTLVNRQQANSALWLNTQGFSNVQADYYWSSSTVANYANGAWVVYMDGGHESSSSKADGNGCVWPVRSGHIPPSDQSDEIFHEAY